MFHPRTLATLAAAAALMTSACAGPEPTAPATSAVASRQNLYSNGPITPNVYRTAEGFVYGLPDLESGLLAWIGLPTDPSADVGCGGDQELPLVPLQAAGWQQAFNVLAVAREVNIHVYDLANFQGTCVSPVIAAGTGHAVYADNDWLNSGAGANAFGLSIEGILTAVPGGEPVRVTGEVRSLNMPDGSFKKVTARLSLTPVRGN